MDIEQFIGQRHTEAVTARLKQEQDQKGYMPQLLSQNRTIIHRLY